MVMVRVRVRVRARALGEPVTSWGWHQVGERRVEPLFELCPRRSVLQHVCVALSLTKLSRTRGALLNKLEVGLALPLVQL